MRNKAVFTILILGAGFVPAFGQNTTPDIEAQITKSVQPAAGSKDKKEKKTAVEPVPEGAERVFWREPNDIGSRNLVYGQGGEKNQPASGPLQFESEDMSASTPKFSVRDSSGTKWKIKLGDEARPETVATRLVWAAGFAVDEDYYLPTVIVKDLPSNIHRGKQFIGSDGSMQGARLERSIENQKKVGIWKWRNDNFAHTREWNGLRTLMALINNWDLKDINNSIYETKDANGQPTYLYVVSDLGSSFGPTHIDMHRHEDKGEYDAYSRSGFLMNERPEQVSFRTPGPPSPIFLFAPWVFIHREKLLWLGRDIPRDDARWMGTVLARLSPDQIRDAFRAGGYNPQEVEGFTAILQKRIAELTGL